MFLCKSFAQAQNKQHSWVYKKSAITFEKRFWSQVNFKLAPTVSLSIWTVYRTPKYVSVNLWGNNDCRIQLAQCHFLGRLDLHLYYHSHYECARPIYVQTKLHLRNWDNFTCFSTIVNHLMRKTKNARHWKCETPSMNSVWDQSVTCKPMVKHQVILDSSIVQGIVLGRELLSILYFAFLLS